MHALKEKIWMEGKVIGNDILKVDSFLNHQVDPPFVLSLGAEIGQRFAGEKIERVLTIEASGIAVALGAALFLNVPLVFAKKKRSRTFADNLYRAVVYSYTRNEEIEICVERQYLPMGERVLIVDDFLAHGAALRALASIVNQAGAVLVGAGVVIEKYFQGGGEALRREGIRVEALAQVASLAGGEIEFID